MDDALLILIRVRLMPVAGGSPINVGRSDLIGTDARALAYGGEMASTDNVIAHFPHKHTAHTFA